MLAGKFVSAGYQILVQSIMNYINWVTEELGFQVPFSISADKDQCSTGIPL